MIGVFLGAGFTAVLPAAISWNVVRLLACLPVVATLPVLRMLLAELPRPDYRGARPLFARSTDATVGRAPAPAGGRAWLGVLAAAAGGAIAISDSTVEQFVIPVRGSRDFGLGRSGIAQLLMLGQVVDIVALLPLGALADRRGAPPVRGGVLRVRARPGSGMCLGPLLSGILTARLR